MSVCALSTSTSFNQGKRATLDCNKSVERSALSVGEKHRTVHQRAKLANQEQVKDWNLEAGASSKINGPQGEELKDTWK